jgi:putative mRNA 3-end processing factor
MAHRGPAHPSTWLTVRPEGLYCEPGGFFIDPHRAVERAVVTHGHSDHARPGHAAVLATAETLAIMRARKAAPASGRALRYGETLAVGGVSVTLQPAGHVLGSAQIVLEHGGSRAVISGDYKRRADPTCAGFVPVPCDVFVTEATFALPVFRHPPPAAEIARLLGSLALFPDRRHVVACYALGKAQHLIALLRQGGWDGPIFLHRALQPLCELYGEFGVELGALRTIADLGREGPGGIVLAPPTALDERWVRELGEPVLCAASGWLRLRKRALQSGAELPLIISDHADWNELLATAHDVGAPEIWVTHGREDALIHALGQRGIRGHALRLLGRGEEA